MTVSPMEAYRALPITAIINVDMLRIHPSTRKIVNEHVFQKEHTEHDNNLSRVIYIYICPCRSLDSCTSMIHHMKTKGCLEMTRTICPWLPFSTCYQETQLIERHTVCSQIYQHMAHWNHSWYLGQGQWGSPSQLFTLYVTKSWKLLYFCFSDLSM